MAELRSKFDYKRPLEGYEPFCIYEGPIVYGDMEIDLADDLVNEDPEKGDIFRPFNQDRDQYVELPDGLVIRGNLFVDAARTEAEIHAHPDKIVPTYNITLPHKLEVFGNAYLAYGVLQSGTHIHGDLVLSGNRNMRELPLDLIVDGDLDLTGCNIDFVPWQVAENVGGKILGITDRCIEQRPQDSNDLDAEEKSTSPPQDDDPNQLFLFGGLDQ